MTREEKAQVVAELKEVIDRSTGMYFTDFQGMTVEQTTRLRSELRKAGVTFKVAKNRLAHLALEGTRFDGLTPMLKGPTALAWSTDPVAAAKATVEFARTNDKLVLIGGALGPQTLDASGVRALAELPSLDALRVSALLFERNRIKCPRMCAKILEKVDLLERLGNCRGAVSGRRRLQPFEHSHA